MTYGIEVTNTDGSILIGDVPPLLQVTQQGSITIQTINNDIYGYNNTTLGTYFGVAKLPAAVNGKNWAFSFSGTALITVPYGYAGIPEVYWGVFCVVCNNAGTATPALLFPKAWIGQSISYVLLDYPTSATSGWGIELRNSANQVILSTGNPLFVFKDQVVNSDMGSFAPDPFNQSVIAGVGYAVNLPHTVPAGKTPYIVGTNMMRDCWADPVFNTQWTNNLLTMFNIHTIYSTYINMRTLYILYANAGYYNWWRRTPNTSVTPWIPWLFDGIQPNSLQIGYVVS